MRGETGQFAASDARPVRTWLLAGAAVAVFVVIIAFLAPGGGSGDDALDPAGTGPHGMKGLVLVLGSLGADLRLSAHPPGPDVTVALLADDALTTAEDAALATWVEGGGTLVVTDIEASINPVRPHLSAIPGAAPKIRSGCTAVPALAAVGELQPGRLVAFEPPDPSQGAVACFDTPDGPYVVISPRGRGRIVSVGGASVFTNDRIARADNAVFVGALLAPRYGTAITYVTPYAPDGALGANPGRRGSPWPPRTKYVVGQGLFAFVALVLWRSRRLGRPVIERPPVELPPSELVVAVGLIDQRGKRRAETTMRIAERTRRRLAARLTLPPDATPAVVAQVFAQRTGADAPSVLRALTAPPPTDDAQLVARANALAQLVVALDPTPMTVS